MKEQQDWEIEQMRKAVSRVAILSLSLAGLAVVPALADDDELRSRLGHRPHFIAKLTNADTVPLVPDRGFSGKAKAWFVEDDGQLKLRYRIVTDMDVNAGFPQTADEEDDITQIHLHRAPPGIAGPHVLNVYKAPAQDDDDVKIRPNQGVISGLWDDEDLSEGLPAGPASEPFSDNIANLCDGLVYANVHGTGDQSTGALRGNFEPTRQGRKVCRALETGSYEEDDD